MFDVGNGGLRWRLTGVASRLLEERHLQTPRVEVSILISTGTPAVGVVQARSFYLFVAAICSGVSLFLFAGFRPTFFHLNIDAIATFPFPHAGGSAFEPKSVTGSV